jgi:riboflavin kinase/FMN adenylyltransferase
VQIHTSIAAAAAAIGTTPVALTAGNFDGVHPGHQALIAATRLAAEQQSGTSVVLTFDPHPEAVIRGRAPEALTTTERRLALLAETGVDHLILQTFDEAFAQTSAEDFLALVAQSFRLTNLLLGYDFRFGKGGRGDLAMARTLAPSLGFVVQQVEAVLVGGEPISSSRIRQVLAAGDVARAAELLGRPWTVEGAVGGGAGRGRTLGFPTANLVTTQPLIVPDGVYGGVALTADGRPWVAAISIGTNPTFGGEPRRLEAFLLDYPDDRVEGPLTVELRVFLRGQVTYPHAAHLIAQIEADVRLIQDTATSERWLDGR